MARIGFIGLGNMGLPMAQNLLKAGHQVEGVDVNGTAVAKLVAAGGADAGYVKVAATRGDVVITMLPSGQGGARGLSRRRRHRRQRQCRHAADRLLHHRRRERARRRACRGRQGAVHARCAGLRRRRRRAGRHADVHGRRGDEAAFIRARPVLEAMGKTIVHAGGAGNGQAAKICNNMILGVSMIAVSEAFVLAEKLGLDHQKLFDISVEIVRPVLVADELLPGAGTGAGLAGQPRLPGGFHRGDDAQGPEARPGCGALGRGRDAARRGGRRALRALRGARGGGAGFLRDYPVPARSITAGPGAIPDEYGLIGRRGTMWRGPGQIASIVCK